MLVLNIFIVILSINSVLTINDTMPDIPSRFLSQSTVLPERSESTKSRISFQQYIPIACFCDQSTCNANVRSVEPPIIGLYTRDRKIVTSLKIKVGAGELMYIILIDPKSSISGNTHLERISYWRLIDSQHQLLAGASLDFETRRQVSVKELKESSRRYSIGSEMEQTAIASLEMTSGLSIPNHEEIESKTRYYYSALEFSQVVGVYQLFHELAIRPSIPLIDYVGNQTTGALCTSYFIIKSKCGFLQLLPPFLQRTSTFRQVAIPITNTAIMPINTTFEMTQNASMTSGYQTKSRRTKWIILWLSFVFIVLAGFLACTWYYLKCRRSRIDLQPVPTYISLQESDDY